MYLDGYELVFKINICNSSFSHKTFKLSEHVVPRHRPEIRKVDFRIFHMIIV